ACARHGAPGFHVAIEGGATGRERLEIGWQRSERLRLANGNRAALAEHVAVQPVVLWTAAEADLLAGEPALGRRLVDRGLVSTRPQALAALRRYREVLAQKRELLAGGKASALATWNDLLAAAAAAVITLRRAYVAELAVALDAVLLRTPLALPPLRV